MLIVYPDDFWRLVDQPDSAGQEFFHQGKRILILSKRKEYAAQDIEIMRYVTRARL
jgi:hypothetical protein